MNINIITTNNKFSFDIGDQGKCVFACVSDGVAIPSVEPFYENAWEACSAARKFVQKYPFHLMHKNAYEVNDASSGYAEGEGLATDKTPSEFLTEHYTKILKKLSLELRNPSPEDKKLFHMSLTSFIMELANLYQTNTKAGRKEESAAAIVLLKNYKKLLNSKFAGKMADVDMQSLNQQLNPQEEGADAGGGLPGMASRKTLIVTSSGDVLEKRIDNETIKELLEDYATHACEAIQDTNNTSYGIERDEDHCYINIFDLSDQGSVDKILVIRVNKLFNVDSIIPVGKLNKIYPYHSVYFYQQYWKPIVDNIGHFYLADTDSLILAAKNEMPDLPKDDDSYGLEAWDVSSGKIEHIDISFKDGDIWYFGGSNVKKEASLNKETLLRYAEQEYLQGAMVMCIDEDQPDLFGEKGQVMQVISLTDTIEVDVKFINSGNIDNKIQKDKKIENPIAGHIVRLSKEQLRVMNPSEIASMKLGV